MYSGVIFQDFSVTQLLTAFHVQVVCMQASLRDGSVAHVSAAPGNIGNALEIENSLPDAARIAAISKGTANGNTVKKGTLSVR